MHALCLTANFITHKHDHLKNKDNLPFSIVPSLPPYLPKSLNLYLLPLSPRSNLRHAAGDDQVGAGAVASVVAKEMGNTLDDLVDRPEPLHRHRPDLLLAHDGRVGVEVRGVGGGVELVLAVPHEPGPDEGGGHGVDADVEGCEVLGGGHGEAENRTLGCDVPKEEGAEDGENGNREEMVY